MSEKYGDVAYLDVQGQEYVVHGYTNESDITVTRPLESLEDYELENLAELLEEDF